MWGRSFGNVIPWKFKGSLGCTGVWSWVWLNLMNWDQEASAPVGVEGGRGWRGIAQFWSWAGPVHQSEPWRDGLVATGRSTSPQAHKVFCDAIGNKAWVQRETMWNLTPFSFLPGTPCGLAQGGLFGHPQCYLGRGGEPLNLDIRGNVNVILFVWMWVNSGYRTPDSWYRFNLCIAVFPSLSPRLRLYSFSLICFK